MSRKRKRNRKRPRKGPAPASRPAGAAAVARLIGSGRTRTALEQAKAAHKQQATAESEGVLIDAYVARARDLAAEGLDTEAAALVDLVCRRFAGAGARTQELAAVLRARRGEIDELLRPLADPETPEAERAAIENVVRCEVTDLERLATSGALPDDHPLKRGAAAVLRAFEAVTRGAVDDPATIAPEEVSRRSPLAPWKLLVRALDAFYRGDDEACARTLDVMESTWQDGGAQDGVLPAPLRAVPALRAMTQGTGGGELPPASAALVAAVQGASRRLRAEMRKLDDAFAEGNPSRIVAGVRRTARLVASHAPERMERFRQEVAVRCFVSDLPVARVRDALGGPVLHEACYWRLLARACEARQDVFVACSAWERFFRHAVAEGRFAAEGPEAAALHLHVAELLAHLDARELEKARAAYLKNSGFGAFYADQPPHLQALAPRMADRDAELDFLRPERLFARAAEHGGPEAYRQWLAWSRRRRRVKEADRVALAWHAAFPEDVAPLLHLAAAAEGRGAFKKALGFVATAEELDRLSPEVRRARQRLLVAMTFRHLRQNLPHLADKDVAALAELPQLRSGDGPALLAALRWATAARRGDKAEAKRCRAELASELASEAATLLVLLGLAAECELGPRWHPSPTRRAPRADRGRVVPAVARAASLAAALGIGLAIPDRWEKALIDELRSASTRTPEELLALAEAALASWLPELAYAAAGVGLAQEGPNRARFLTLRGKSLPPWAPDRALECLHAAIALARRQGDPELLSEVVEKARRTDDMPLGELMSLGMAGPVDLSGDEVAEILRREVEAREFPAEPEDDDDDGGALDFDPFCPCPECTRRRAELGIERLDEDDEGPDFPADLELGGLPPSLLRLMMEATLKYGGPGGDVPDPETLERLDPDLARRIHEALLELRASGFTWPTRRRRRGRKRRR